MQHVPNSQFDYRRLSLAERLPAFRQMTASLYETWPLEEPETFRVEAFGYKVKDLIFNEVEFSALRFKRGIEHTRSGNTNFLVLQVQLAGSELLVMDHGIVRLLPGNIYLQAFARYKFRFHHQPSRSVSMRYQLRHKNVNQLGALLLAGSLVLPSLVLASGDYTQIPDEQFEQVLIDRGIDSEGNLDGQILTTDMAAATTITGDETGIMDLTGIEAAHSLKTLLLFGNDVATLDLANNGVLATLDVSQNQLQGIIDLSNKPDLISVDLTGNPNLLCVQVDNQADAMAKTGQYEGWSLDVTTTYSHDCSAAYPGF